MIHFPRTAVSVHLSVIMTRQGYLTPPRVLHKSLFLSCHNSCHAFAPGQILSLKHPAFILPLKTESNSTALTLFFQVLGEWLYIFCNEQTGILLHPLFSPPFMNLISNLKLIRVLQVDKILLSDTCLGHSERNS